MLKDELLESERGKLLKEARDKALKATEQAALTEDQARERLREAEQRAQSAIQLAEMLRKRAEDLGSQLDAEALEHRFDEAVENPKFQDAVVKKVQMPAGSVMAFALETGCPKGWSSYQQAAGRVIVGVGDGNLDFHGNRLIKRNLGDSGGEEKHELTRPEMPMHRHAVPANQSDKTAPWGKEDRSVWSSNPPGEISAYPLRTSPAGETKAHNNMPPYIALYWCKKD